MGPGTFSVDWQDFNIQHVNFNYHQTKVALALLVSLVQYLIILQSFPVSGNNKMYLHTCVHMSIYKNHNFCKT